MKLYDITRFGILGISFSAIHPVSAVGRLRGINATTDGDEDGSPNTELTMDEDQHIISEKNDSVLDHNLLHYMDSVSDWKRNLKGPEKQDPNIRHIVGSDDRRTFRDTSYPWRCVGKVETPGGSCTGTMIGKKLMITAQHCVDWNTDGSFTWMKFTPAYYDGEAPFGSAYADYMWWGKKIPDKSRYYDHEFAWDWVIVKLDRDLGVSYWGYKAICSRWEAIS